MPDSLSPADIAALARVAGLHFPEEDLAPISEAMAAHLAFVEPLLAAHLDDVDAVLTLDPRWHD